MNFTESEENYLKEIYHLETRSQRVSASLLSEAVQTKASSVTDMLKKLSAKKMVHYKPYQNFTLTDKGTAKALEIIRKHRLWEYFLVSILGFSWKDVHPVAEQLEHISSNELIQRLDDFLGNPAFDPHGDPIPDKNGKIEQVQQASLLEIPLKVKKQVIAIGDQTAPMMDLLNHYQIGIGTTITIVRRFAMDDSLQIKIGNKQPIVLSGQIAKNIYCAK